MERPEVDGVLNLLAANETAHAIPNFPEEAVAIAENDLNDYLILLPHADGSGDLQETLWMWEDESGAITRLSVSVNQLKEPQDPFASVDQED